MDEKKKNAIKEGIIEAVKNQIIEEKMNNSENKWWKLFSLIENKMLK